MKKKTLGLRGVVDLEIEVTGPKRDLHSGFDGDCIDQPLADLIYLTSQFFDKEGKILIPGFYDNIRSLTEEEKVHYNKMDFNLEQYKESLGVSTLKTDTVQQLLIRKWCNPSLIVTSIESSATKGTISKSVKCCCNIRFVPDQKADDLIRTFINFSERKFQEKQTSNELKIRVLHTGEAWIGDYKNKYYLSAAQAIKEVWGIEPLFVREGGSQPVTSFLEGVIRASVLHLPFGQSTDRAHLQNERIRLENLFSGKNVLKSFLKKFPT